jgi:hypothetical protein
MKLLIPVIVFIILVCGRLDALAMTVELQFLPTASTAPGQMLQSKVKELLPVRLVRFTDSRVTAETELGEFNINGQMEKVQANIPVAEFASDSFRNIYEEWGGRVAADGRFALKGEVTHFSFEEAEGYQARVGIHFSLADDNGRVVWDGHSSGVIKGGRAVTPKTLTNIMSDVLLATYKELFEEQKLVGVWSGKVSSTYEIRE